MIAVAAGAFLVAGVIKGAIGIGQITVAVSLLATALPLREAVPLLILPAIVSNIIQVVQGGDRPAAVAVVRRFALTNALGCAGVWAGTVLLFSTTSDAASAVLGIVVAAYAAMNLLRYSPTVPPRIEPALTPVVGLASGVLTGLTGSLHLGLAAWFQAIRLTSPDFIRATGGSFLLASVFWVAALITEGQFGPREAIWSAAALIPTFAGLWMGNALRNRVPEATFRKIVFAGLLLLALNMIWKAAG